MAIDGLGNITGIIPVKKEKEAGEPYRKNQKKDRGNEENDKDKEKDKNKEGRVDIRI